MVKRALVLLWLGLAWLSLSLPARAQDDSSPVVIVLEVDGAVSTTWLEYFQRGLRAAGRQSAQAIVLQMNTPGGSVSVMNLIVQEIRNSPVPVIVYVAPRGAMAGSAGTLITLAGHAAAMAPETAIGAASPVGMQGEDIGETLALKEKEILRATVRSLAARRSPEAIALAEETIENARAVSASEALQIGLVDFIAADLPDLLRQADGFRVTLPAGEQRLSTAGARLERLANTPIEQLLNVLTNPNIVFLLLTIGVQAILIELSSPGGWFAGFIGVISLALAVYGLGLLPVNWFGLIFLLTAFVLFVLDVKAPTHGALTAAGIGSFIAGALILFNGVEAPGIPRLSTPLVIVTAVLIGLTFAAAIGFALRAQRLPIQTGQEALVGRQGVVRSELAPRGQVQLGGELWTAELEQPAASLPRGARVVVVRVEGLRLIVRPA
jgi:membrane-bound serine protease (ClpP class)